MNLQTKEKIVSMYLKGAPLVEIGKACGITAANVANHLKNMRKDGIKLPKRNSVTALTSDFIKKMNAMVEKSGKGG